MVKILLLSDIIEKAFEPGAHCLFGKRNFVTIPKMGRYDFYFHSLDGVSPENLKPSEFARIPILNYEYPTQEDESKIRMAELYKGNGLDTFALKDRSNRVAETSGGKTRVVGNFLKFYSAKEKEDGVRIELLEDDAITTRELMKKFLSNWESVANYLNLQKEKIEKDYRS